MLRLEFPNESHRTAYEDLVREWRAAETTPTSPGRLFCGENFDEFLGIVRNEPTESDPAKVPATLFFLVDSESTRILGAIHIRHHIDHPNLIEIGGHIGYGIRPSERKKGYATKMLALALPEAKKLGLSRVLVTCEDANIASAKVIEANGGVFERMGENGEKKGQRYWIEIA